MPRLKAIVPAALIVLVALFVGAPASASQHSDVKANKAMVTFVYDQLFNHANVSVIDTFIDPIYIQHNPRLVDGPEALRQLIINGRAQNPDSHTTIVRVTAQRDLVMIHRHSMPQPGALGSSGTDVFRVSKGKIVEHWDVIQPVPATTASGNDMFATLSKSGDQSTLRTERTALSFYTALTAQHDLRAVDRFVSPSLIQHDPALTNGSAAVKTAFAARLQANPQLTFSSLQVIADQDLISLRYHVQNSPTDLGQAVNDIYRVGDGKIVEQWSVTQNVPATSANDNTMF